MAEGSGFNQIELRLYMVCRIHVENLHKWFTQKSPPRYACFKRCMHSLQCSITLAGSHDVKLDNRLLQDERNWKVCVCGGGLQFQGMHKIILIKSRSSISLCELSPEDLDKWNIGHAQLNISKERSPKVRKSTGAQTMLTKISFTHIKYTLSI